MPGGLCLKVNPPYLTLLCHIIQTKQKRFDATSSHFYARCAKREKIQSDKLNLSTYAQKI